VLRGDGPVLARPVAALLVAVTMLVAMTIIVVGCGATTGSASPAPVSSPSVPVAGSGPASSDSGDPGALPGPTSWPGGVVEAIMNLGKADAQIQAAGADLGAAAAYEDLEAMWGAADGLATLLDRLIPQVDRIKDYPETAPAAKALQAAFPDMFAGAGELRDAIKAGDAAGIVSGSKRLATGLEAYRLARRELGPLVDQAILMQRILVK
jgi:hypothetical protein